MSVKNSPWLWMLAVKAARDWARKAQINIRERMKMIDDDEARIPEYESAKKALKVMEDVEKMIDPVTRR